MKSSSRGQKVRAKPSPPVIARPAAESSPTNVGRLRTVLDYTLLSVALGVTLFSLVTFAHGYSPILFADSWTVLTDFKNAGFRFSLPSLLSFHNEHRPLFARVPILADQLWAGGRGWLPFGLIFLTQTAHAWLLWWIASKQPTFHHRQRLLVLALAIFCSFSPAQMENFIWTFQTAFVLNFFFATAALASVAAQKQDPSPKWIAAIVVCGFSAPMCLASGVFLWWLVVLMALAVRLERKWIVIYSAAGLLTLTLYLQGYVQQEGPNGPLDALRQPLQILLYVGYFFASCWKWWTIYWGELLALAAMALLAWRILALLRKHTTSPWEAVPAGVMLFSLGTGFLAALGRLKLGIEQGGASRYQTPALLFWFMAALLVMAVLPRKSEGAALAFTGFALVAMLSIFPASKGIEGLVVERRLAWDQAGAAWVSGVEDKQVIDGMFAGNQLTIRDAYFQRRLGWFSVPPGSAMGSIVGVERIQVSNFCQGMFHREALLLDKQWPGIRLRGSARVSSDGAEIREFISTTIDRRVIGVGNSGIVYAAVKSAKEALVVYGLLDRGRVCAILTD